MMVEMFSVDKSSYGSGWISSPMSGFYYRDDWTSNGLWLCNWVFKGSGGSCASLVAGSLVCYLGDMESGFNRHILVDGWLLVWCSSCIWIAGCLWKMYF